MARSRGLWVLAGVVGTVIGLVFAYMVATGTDAGRSWLLSAMLGRASGVFKGRGTLSVGRLRVISPSYVKAENVALLDSAGVPVVHAEFLEGRLNARGLFSKAIHIRSLALRNVRMDFRQDFKGPFNIKYIISGDTSKGPSKGPGFGDDIRIDTLHLTNGVLTLISPWSPNAVFTGSARDSVIMVRDSLHDITRTPLGLRQRRVVTLDRVMARDAVITDPKKGPASMRIDTLRGRVSDPPVVIAAVSGGIRWTGDSLKFEFPEIRLPASSGSAIGAISWNQPGPLHYDALVQVKAGLSDLGWIWNVLPSSGGGTATVRMRTLASADDAEYTLSALDVSTMESRVTGDISVVTRPASLELRGVDLSFAPLGSELLRRLSYDALPPEVRGVFTGRLVAPDGGPLTAFKIGTLDARFVDSNVPGAVSGARLSGLVSLGSSPAAWNARVDDARIDLRSMRALLPDAPAVDGTLAGALRITSADLRAADVTGLALTWTDGAGNVSRVTGSARMRYADSDPAMTLDLSLDPLSMRALARIDTTIPLRSALAGRVEARGTLSALTWSARVAADTAGSMAFAGTASVRQPAWSVAASGIIDNFDVRTWFGSDATTPSTSLDGNIGLTANGTRDSTGIEVAAGTASVVLVQEGGPARPAFDLLASGALDAHRYIVDSAAALLGGVRFTARGALARDSTRVDTLNVAASADSLEAIRPELARLAAMLEPVDSAVAKTFRGIAGDTLRGDFSLAGPLFGAINAFDATLALSVREGQVGAIRVGRIFGSARATDVLRRPFFEAAATADEVSGIGAIRVSTAEFRLQQASPDSGRLVLDVSAQDTSHLVVRGGYFRTDSVFRLDMDSLRFTSGSAIWRNVGRIRVVSDATGVRVDSTVIRSSERGALALVANLPSEGPVTANVELTAFPIGTATAFTLGTPLFAGSLTGQVRVNGTRVSPLIEWGLRADSLGMNGNFLPRITSEGTYAERRLVARALLTDSAGGSVRAEARVPVDLALQSVEKRLLSDAVDAEILADSLRLNSLGFAVTGVSRPRGTLGGRMALTGTMDRPIATGTMRVEGLGATFDDLGIDMYGGRMVVRAAEDSLILESFRINSGGPLDSIGASGAVRFAKGTPATMRARVTANNMVMARMRDGTNVDVSGNLQLVGPLRLPELSGSLFVPRANIVTDPLGARNALDLKSAAARELLGADEIPIAVASTESFASLGRFFTVSNARVDLGDEVWVRTPEANLRVTGGLNIRSASGNRLALEGEVNANRGQYRLDLGVVNRSFTVDSGRVRFYGTDAIEPTLDISATNVVRRSEGEEIPIRVHIGGTLSQPTLTLSSSSPTYAAAPESEIISLLIFGEPTFALSNDNQSTVRAVTGVLAPSAGGFVEGALQRLVPGFNTVQVNTASGQQDELNALSLLDNLSITAGKQIGDRAFLRLNTGVCRGTAAASRGTGLYYGIAVEYRLATSLLAQLGYDPGAAPCVQTNNQNGRTRMQFGFDLFREWIF
ncbi:MAG TPA: translocation/assembly module TamB domain-containing protein [Gemmatimonas sp.]|nr:translocation/assembly module TamB domain-containing protein [Gemmatimonas sp.]